MEDVMIDLETLGVKPNAVIINHWRHKILTEMAPKNH